jgi:hypothetical protein
MAKLISSRQVQESNDVRYRDIPVDEWEQGASLRIRSFTARELVSFTSLKGDNQKQGIVRGLIMCAVDENGERIFTNDDVGWLMDKNVKVLHRIQEAILIHNGMRKDPDAEDGDDEGNGDKLQAAGKG